MSCPVLPPCSQYIYFCIFFYLMNTFLYTNTYMCYPTIHCLHICSLPDICSHVTLLYTCISLPSYIHYTVSIMLPFSFTTMQMPPTLLKDVTQRHHRWSVQVRIARLWDCQEQTAPFKVYRVDFVMIDSEVCTLTHIAPMFCSKHLYTYLISIFANLFFNNTAA